MKETYRRQPEEVIHGRIFGRQCRHDWTLENRHDLILNGGLLIFMCRRIAKRFANKNFRAVKLSDRHRTYAYKRTK